MLFSHVHFFCFFYIQLFTFKSNQAYIEFSLRLRKKTLIVIFVINKRERKSVSTSKANEAGEGEREKV